MNFKKRFSTILLASLFIINLLQTINVFATTSTGPIETVNPTTQMIYKTIFANGKYYIVGGDQSDGKKAFISSSADFITWQDVNVIANASDGTSSLDLDTLFDIKYANGVFIAVGAASSIGANMARSTDGINWTAIRNPSPNYFNSVEYSSVASIWIAGGLNGQVFTSADNGVTWATRTTANSEDIGSVIYANGKFLAVGWAGSAQSSVNGIAWTNIVSPMNEYLRSVSFLNGKYIAVGWLGGVYESSNGTVWAPKSLGLTGTYDFYQTIYADNKYVVIGCKIEGAIEKSVAITSSDFTSWSEIIIDNGPISFLTSVIYNDNKFRMTNMAGRVHSTTISINGDILPNGQPRCYFNVEASTTSNKNIGQGLDVYKALLTKVDSSAGNKSLLRIIALLTQIGTYDTYKPYLLSGSNKL